MTDDFAPDQSTLLPDQLLAVVCEMLDAHHYRYQLLDGGIASLTLRGAHGAVSVAFRASAETDYVGILGSYGSFVPDVRRLAVAEAVSRCNMQLPIGNFELDFDDGELRFRIGMDVEGGLFGSKMAETMLSLTMWNLDRYHDALMRVAFGEIEPVIALADVE
jgi:hypothetical protein